METSINILVENVELQIKEIAELYTESHNFMEKYWDKIKKANDTLRGLKVKIELCKSCKGKGTETYTYGYQSDCVGNRACDMCKGEKFIIVDSEDE